MSLGWLGLWSHLSPPTYLDSHFGQHPTDGNAASSHSEVGVSSVLTPPSSRVLVAVLVDCPHEPQFLPDMNVSQSASVAGGRATHQVLPLSQTGRSWGIWNS